MAKKIRFPLKLARGAEVRTLEELREHFDMEAILEYYKNGKLLTWLEDRYLEGEAEAVQALDAAAPDFQRQLCEVFQVEYTGNDVDLEEIERRQERLKRLRTITDDAEFIENIDRVAFDQEELADLLDDGANKIYLCGERFAVPASRTGVTYVGIKNPTVHISGNVPKTLERLEIEFVEITCDNLPKCSEQKISEMISRTSRFVVLEHYYLYNYSSETSQFYRYEIATGEEESLPSDLIPVLGDSCEWVCAGDEIAYLRNGILCSINIHSLTKKDYPGLKIYGKQFAFSKKYIAVRTTDNFCIDIYNRQGQKLHKITSPLHENRLMLDGEVVNRDYKLTCKTSAYDSSEIQIFGGTLFFKLDSYNFVFGCLNLDDPIPTCKVFTTELSNACVIAMAKGSVYLKGSNCSYDRTDIYCKVNLKTGMIYEICKTSGESSLLAKSDDYLVIREQDDKDKNSFLLTSTFYTTLYKNMQKQGYTNKEQDDKDRLWAIELSTGKVKKIPYAVQNSSRLNSVRFLLLGSTLYCINKSDGTNCKFELSLLVPEASGAIPTEQAEKYSSASEAEKIVGASIRAITDMKPVEYEGRVCRKCGYIYGDDLSCPKCGTRYFTFGGK